MHYLLLALLILAFLLLIFYLGYIVYTSILEPGAIYYPTPDDRVEAMLDLAQVGPKDTLLDLGSGDGRIVIAAANRGAKAIGYEINPFLVKSSNKAIAQAGLSHLAKVVRQSMWHADYNQATVISLYLFPNLMNRLHRHLKKKLHHPLRLVSHDYQFPHKKYSKKSGSVYLYLFHP